MDKVLLNINNLCVNYGHHTVLDGINLSLREGEVLCLLGKNGVGKSTLLKSVAGLINLKSGKIVFDGLSIEHLNTEERSKLGIAYLMQTGGIFPRLTVEDHILLASQKNKKQKLSDIWNTIRSVFPQMEPIKKKTAGEMSGGQKRLLSFSMLIALGSEKLWLLDEPSAGISLSLLNSIDNFFKDYVSYKGITAIVVEQNAIFGKKIASSFMEI